MTPEDLKAAAKRWKAHVAAINGPDHELSPYYSDRDQQPRDESALRDWAASQLSSPDLTAVHSRAHSAVRRVDGNRATNHSDRSQAVSELNLDHDEARALHRIVRAMHDGECPKCHDVHQSEEMPTYFWSKNGTKYQVGWECPSCGFTITKEEADAVFAIFAPFMERNLAVFEKWRQQRGAKP